MTVERPSLVRPPVLQKGDTVGIVAPSGPVNRQAFEAGVLALQQLELVPVFSESIFERDLYFAGGVQRRIDELHKMFRQPEVKAIISARGGYGSNYLLPDLDLELIGKHPKIFCGYSDLTTLLTYFHDKLGLVGFHGPMVAKDFSRLGGVHAKSFSFASSGQPQWMISNADSPAIEAICEGEAVGKLYGGCLSLLVASLGTTYEIQTDDTILFLEDLGEWPYRVDRMLMHMKYAGKLGNVRGIVFGEMVDCSPSSESGYTLQQAIRRILSDFKIPVAFGLRSGHVSAGNITLPIGVRARLTVTDTATLEILEAATSPRRETIKAGKN